MNKGVVKLMLILVIIGGSFKAFGLDKEEKVAINAIKNGDLKELAAYLEKHPGPDCEFSNGKTGLYYAIEHGKPEVAYFLLTGGADPNYIVSDLSILNWAIRFNRERIIRYLVEFGAAVNVPDEKLNTPLIHAAKQNHAKICKILVDRGANPLYQNDKENRASYYASQYGDSPAYKYLLLMEGIVEKQDSLPSMQDGPYIAWETEDQAVMTYYEHKQDGNLTRLFEKTIKMGKDDTNVDGIGWDKNSYLLKKNFTTNPDSISTDGNIFVLGDIHGRYFALLNLLKNNRIIDSDLNWAYGNGQLVLLGDLFDRGGFVTETLWFLYGLEIQAQQAGGDVHVLLGNHEVMAMTGDHRYINDKYRFFTQYSRIYYFQLFDKNTLLGGWLRSKNIMTRINDYLFLHAGISPQLAIYGYGFSEINQKVRDYLYSDYQLDKTSPEALILGALGPLWYRGYMNYNENFPALTQEFVDMYLDSKDLKKMILGHNVQKTIETSFNGKIISADVEIDESGITAQGLLISGGEFYRCFADGTKEKIE